MLKPHSVIEATTADQALGQHGASRQHRTPIDYPRQLIACLPDPGWLLQSNYSAEAIPCRMAYAVRAASVWMPSFSAIFCL